MGKTDICAVGPDHQHHRRNGPGGGHILKHLPVLLLGGQVQQFALHRLELAAGIKIGASHQGWRAGIAHINLLGAGKPAELLLHRVVVAVVVSEAGHILMPQRIQVGHPRHHTH